MQLKGVEINNISDKKFESITITISLTTLEETQEFYRLIKKYNGEMLMNVSGWSSSQELEKVLREHLTNQVLK